MATEITAPLAGKIVRSSLKEGESVIEDQEIIVIDAMKMETPVYAPAEGVIGTINKKEGDEVEEGDVIAVYA